VVLKLKPKYFDRKIVGQKNEEKRKEDLGKEDESLGRESIPFTYFGFPFAFHFSVDPDPEYWVPHRVPRFFCRKELTRATRFVPTFC
jgi:hypothetical protein